MFTLTAMLRAGLGHEGAVKAALLRVGEYVRLHEPETVGFHVTQSADDPCLFVTHERFSDRAAMIGTIRARDRRSSLRRQGICSTAPSPW
ncbi:MAG: antibiotic biosynthesis monooxygenase [Proteobacteria bacterium]|nr:antibiotic biosynthesis monooxygenase [Pseudomonadota bacterium]